MHSTGLTQKLGEGPVSSLFVWDGKYHRMFTWLTFSFMTLSRINGEAPYGRMSVIPGSSLRDSWVDTEVELLINLCFILDAICIAFTVQTV